LFVRRAKPFPVRVAGLDFSNPIGLAAGFDKNAVLLPGIENLGFGFIEIGTVTPKPQAGNPKPRVSRIAERRALLNRMGFPNDGAQVIAARLRHAKPRLQIPVGVNLGKNRDTPNSEALRDYESLLSTFVDLADYFVINISSPNTPGLRDLQSKEFIDSLASALSRRSIGRPVFIKLAPDVSHEALGDIAKWCGTGRAFAGLILSNTIPTDLGGISGYPLKGPSLQLLKLARSMLPGTVPLISVGGIENAQDVVERLENGASAVQLYSALIYQGPGLVGRILRELKGFSK
ncbi:MAG: quinone-dependent dihydroorotate dehydrogenase, partial [Bdellovibrionota bacterium]